ncbi:putative Serine/arginine-rich splicing factor RS31 [Blattamonas nauphoetae]|uniref:Serine/arginine-rich splicing factor RS31 n=1 Tax=Blattamonas nauphoetae TaxID=2049346 RepID=A0ABQ9Y4Z6_9EUKA|nr:putative Serine/arginine-rich splicing factor RS31 [Blattamonas nauphoetae]
MSSPSPERGRSRSPRSPRSASPAPRSPRSATPERVQSPAGEDKPSIIWIGHLVSVTTKDDISRAVSKYGTVESVDMKRGFAFVTFRGDANQVIREMDGQPLHPQHKPVRVEITKGQRRLPPGSGAVAPSETLFVVGFDPVHVNKDRLYDLFNNEAPVVQLVYQRNHMFVEYRTVTDAEKALNKLNGAQLGGDTISVEFSSKRIPRGPPRNYRDSYSRGGDGYRSRYSRSPSPRRHRYRSYSRSRSRSPRRSRYSRSRSPRGRR